MYPLADIQDGIAFMREGLRKLKKDKENARKLSNLADDIDAIVTTITSINEEKRIADQKKSDLIRQYIASGKKEEQQAAQAESGV